MDSIQSQFCFTILLTLFFATGGWSQDDMPRSTDPRLKIELYAENPQIVTPTGMDVDHDGRVWAIESNTHFPPEDYKGHPTDRILVMEGREETGRVKKITVFKDGLTHSMSIAVKPVWLDILAPSAEKVFSKTEGTSETSPAPLEVYIATRREILLCVDTDGDLKCDKTTQIVHLETTGNYPHNGLAGIAFDAMGNMFFGFGENLGADYKIIGSDGTTLSGGGEGGNVYRCRPDGSKLERWATGFWNPHASCFDAFGHLFTLDNDPDSRPPCRLLHIIEDGDYGYRFRYGRKGTHPFSAWNGEIPGTLPMVSGTGEAPSGIVCYESNGLPKDYVGTLLVGSWGDHRIDQFVLKPRGASFESIPHPIIKGGENFRPVGLAVAPDGSLFFSDWVSREYKLHGLGRVWRISSVTPEKPPALASTEELIKSTEGDSKVELSDVLVERRIQARKMAQSPAGRSALKRLLNDERSSERSRVEAMWSLANVPLSVEKLNLGKDGSAPSNFLKKLDWVSIAASELFDTPQLLPDAMPQNAKSSDIVGEAVAIPNNDWSRFVFIQITEYLLKTHKLSGVGYLMAKKDPFLHTLTNKKLKKVLANVRAPSVKEAQEADPELVCELTWRLLLLRAINPRSSSAAHAALAAPSIDIRRVAVQWIGEEQLKELRPEVERVLGSEPMNGDLFMACLASLSLLDGAPPSEFEKATPVQLVLPIVKDANRPASLRAIALRILPSTLKELDGPLMTELVRSADMGLRTEAVRSLALSKIPEREELLRNIAQDRSQSVPLRADAVTGLVNPDHRAKLNPITRDLLIDLAANDKNLPVRIEAIRSLRGVDAAKSTGSVADPDVVAALSKLRSNIGQEPVEARGALTAALDLALGTYATPSFAEVQDAVAQNDSGGADSNITLAEKVDAGRRTFYHVNGAGCFKCHTIGGRGGQVGPDLTVIARTMNRAKLTQSILEPSKEISPQFTTWAIETTSGKVLNGMLLGEEVNGDLRLGNSQGEIFHVPFREIVTRTPMKTSVMPEKLYQLMTVNELKDLVTFLETLK